MVTPVMKPAALLDARNEGCAGKFRYFSEAMVGVWLMISCPRPRQIAGCFVYQRRLVLSSQEKPGAMPLTLILLGANSLAAAMVRLSTPAFAAS